METTFDLSLLSDDVSAADIEQVKSSVRIFKLLLHIEDLSSSPSHPPVHEN